MISKWKTWSCGTNSRLPFAINAMFNLSIDFIYIKVNLNILSRSQYQLNLQPGVLYYILGYLGEGGGSEKSPQLELTDA